jgi:hypothetical protein
MLEGAVLQFKAFQSLSLQHNGVAVPVYSNWNAFKVELVREIVRHGTMEGLWRAKDSSFVHARRSEWRSVTDTVTSHKIRDTREGFCTLANASYSRIS